MTSGIHLLHKPVGPTSFSVVQQCLAAVRAAKPEKPPRVCHGGTLDPFASGLLLILIEPATKLFDYLHAIPKTYRATVRWGIETDNGDPHGAILSTVDASGLTSENLETVLQTFIGWRDQIPHATSAKRIGGERAYLKAHRGETVEMPTSHVYLHEAKWLSHDLPRQSELELTARGGYYVRALARDLGRKMGCGAHLSELRRVSIGPWSDPGQENPVEIHGREIMPWAPARILSDAEVGALRQKKAIPIGEIQSGHWSPPAGFPDPQAPIRAFHRNKLCFLLTPRDDGLHLLTALRGGL